MAGIGLEGAYGVAGAQEGLQQLLAQRMQQQAIQRQIAQQQFDNQMREKQFQSTEELKRAQLEDIAQNRGAQQQDRLMQRATGLADQIPAGTALPPTDPAVGILRTGGQGSLLTHQDPTLASTQYAQALIPGKNAPTSGGMLRTVSQGNPEQYIKGQSFKQASDAADQATKQAELERRQNADAATERYRAGKLARPVGGLMAGGMTGGLNPGGLDLAATQYAQTGQMPPLGMGSAGARSAIINRAAELFPQTNIAQNTATFSADKTSLTNVQKMRDAVGAFEQTASKNSTIMEQAARKLTDTNSPWLNRPFRQVEQQGMGDSNVAAFAAARRVVVNEYARIVSNPNLAGVLSDEARREMDSVLTGDATIPQMLAVLKVLRSDAENRRVSFDDALTQIKGRIGSGTNHTQSTQKPSAADLIKKYGQ